MRAGGWLWLIALAAVLAGCAAPETERRYEDAYGLALTSPGTQFLNVPQAVQRTVRTEAGGAEIANIMKDTNAGRIVYRITFAEGQLLPPLYVAEDGSVLSPELTVAVKAPAERGAGPGGATGRLTVNDLPPKVLEAIKARAPNTEPATIEQQPYGNQIVYIIGFRDPNQPRLYVAPDGTILAEETR